MGRGSLGRVLPALALAVAVACGSDGPGSESVEAPISGIEEQAGPVVDLGEVPSSDGGRIGLRGFRNQAGGVCLDEDDDLAPICFPPATLDDGAEIVSSRFDRGRVCAYVFTPLDVSEVSISAGDRAHVTERVPGSDQLGVRVFAGCYEDQPPLDEPQLVVPSSPSS